MLNPLAQYKEQSINTMTKGELVVKLFDAALKNLKYCKILMTDGNYAASSKCAEKSKNIFTHLCNTLNRNIEISQNLYQLYTFINQQTIKADIKRDTSILDEIIPIVSDLRDTWAQAEKIVHTKVL